MAAAWSLRAMAALPWDLKFSDSGVVGDAVGVVGFCGSDPVAVVVLLLPAPAAAVSLPFSFS